MAAGLDFQQLRMANLGRARRRLGGVVITDSVWNASDWMLSASAEMGRASDLVLALRRGECGMADRRDPGRPELLVEVARGLGEVVILLDLVAAYLAIDLGTAVTGKFNQVSERESFPERLGVDGLGFDDLRVTNLRRCRRWHQGRSLQEFPWTCADWALAASGEMGETANQVKKLRRIDSGAASRRDPLRDVVVGQIADEMGDVVTYLDLLAAYLGIDLGSSVAMAFNDASEIEGFPEGLEATGPVMVTVEDR
jgi:NTP pyrophosphatase (non-canonical NTP hydrolase)